MTTFLLWRSTRVLAITSFLLRPRARAPTRNRNRLARALRLRVGVRVRVGARTRPGSDLTPSRRGVRRDAPYYCRIDVWRAMWLRVEGKISELGLCRLLSTLNPQRERSDMSTR